MVSRKIRLKPTKQQEELFMKSAGTARFVYNMMLAAEKEAYQNGEKFIHEMTFRKRLTELKREELSWLREVSSNVVKQACKDCQKAFDKFFARQAKHPKFKSRNKTRLSFYVNYETFKRTCNGFRGEKLGNVKTSETLPKADKYMNPHISHDGKYWYVSFVYEAPDCDKENTSDLVIGIDLGVKGLAILSNGTVYPNINKSKEVRRLKKKLRRAERASSRKVKSNIEKYDENKKPHWKRPLRECKNHIKAKKKIKLLHRRLKNIRDNYIHQITAELVKATPKAIVIEDLAVTNMMKNHHLAKSIVEQKWYEFRRILTYKCSMNNIELRVVSRFYPSSKTCSRCGHIKKDLKLSERIYKCPECGLVIDRDLSAAINLSRYELSA
jgi:transposase, IS605 orfB family